jgi:TetR/AcrR family transcriptional regulator
MNIATNDPTGRQASTPGESTRRALMTAAAALFAEKGLDGTSVEEIARKAGANKAMISYYFRGKRNLYTEILVETFARVTEPLAALRALSIPADLRLRRFIEIFGELHAAEPSFSVMLLRELLAGGLHLDDRIFPRFLEVFSDLGEIIRQGVRDGTFRRVDPFLTHMSIIGSLVFFFATTRARNRMIAEHKLPIPIPSPDAFVRHISELMTRGLAVGDAPRDEGRR